MDTFQKKKLQLDSMIAAVKMESSALDSMKEKLKEVDVMRNQISSFTKRLLEADQNNLNLKNNLIKLQEINAVLKKEKEEVIILIIFTIGYENNFFISIYI